MARSHFSRTHHTPNSIIGDGPYDPRGDGGPSASSVIFVELFARVRGIGAMTRLANSTCFWADATRISGAHVAGQSREFGRVHSVSIQVRVGSGHSPAGGNKMNTAKPYAHLASLINRLKRSFPEAVPLAIGIIAIFAPLRVVSAVHDDGSGVGVLFELGPGSDGGVTDLTDDKNPSNGPDWADIFDINGDVVEPLDGLAALFLEDDPPARGKVDETVFFSSNENGDPIGQWQWDTSNVPAKDDLSNVYAYAKSREIAEDTWELIL